MPRHKQSPEKILAYEGVICYVSPKHRAGHKAIYHASKGRDEFYTDYKQEYDGLPSSYAKKGIAFYVARHKRSDHVPLSRLYCRKARDRFYSVPPHPGRTPVKRRRYRFERRLGYVRTIEDGGDVAFMRAWNPHKRRHFFTTDVTEIDIRNFTLTKGQLSYRLGRELGLHFHKWKRLYFSDYSYFCPTKDAADAIIKGAGVHRLRYAAARLDCDDFAHLLKSAFIRDAFHGKVRTVPYALGVVVGKPGGVRHASNVLVTSNGIGHSVWLVEPQLGTLRKPSPLLRENIYLISM